MYLEFEEWENKYKPIKNHIDVDSAYDGLMFETFGKELEHVISVDVPEDTRQVWTLVEAGGIPYIVPGYHIVNRLGYFITEKIEADSSIAVFTGSLKDYVEELINEYNGGLYNAIEHGDIEHKRWLLDKMRDYQNDYLNSVT